MKGKIIKTVVYGANAFTIQYLISFGRFERVDYIKLMLIAVILFLAGYIVKYYESKINFHTLFFLTISLGLPFIASLNNHWLISWVMELAIGIPSFFIGFLVDRYRMVRKSAAVLSLGLYTAAMAFYINPRIVYNKYAAEYSVRFPHGNPVSFSFKNADNMLISDRTYRGKVVLVDYWFIGCTPCYWKMKELNRLADYYKDNKEVKIITVDAGFRDQFEQYKNEIKKFSGQMEHLYDSAGLTAERFHIKGYPTEWLIDKNGVLTEEFTGYTKDIALVYFEKTKKKIDALLRKN